MVRAWAAHAPCGGRAEGDVLTIAPPSPGIVLDSHATELDKT